MGLLWKKTSNRPFVCRSMRGMLVCVRVLDIIVLIVSVAVLRRVHILLLYRRSAMSFVAVVIGPLSSAFVRHIGFMGVSRLTILVCLFIVVSGHLLLTIPLNARRLGLLILVSWLCFYYLVCAMWNFATILLRMNSVLRWRYRCVISVPKLLSGGMVFTPVVVFLASIVVTLLFWVVNNRLIVLTPPHGNITALMIVFLAIFGEPGSLSAVIFELVRIRRVLSRLRQYLVNPMTRPCFAVV